MLLAVMHLALNVKLYSKEFAPLTLIAGWLVYDLVNRDKSPP